LIKPAGHFQKKGCPFPDREEADLRSGCPFPDREDANLCSGCPFPDREDANLRSGCPFIYREFAILRTGFGVMYQKNSWLCVFRHYGRSEAIPPFKTDCFVAEKRSSQ